MLPRTGMEAINAQGILEHADVLSRFTPNLPDSTGVLKCVSDRKEGRTKEPRVKSSTNALEGLQNLDLIRLDPSHRKSVGRKSQK